jgi:hypothetical protein
MRKFILSVAGLLVLGFCVAPVAHAQGFNDAAVNINGTTYCAGATSSCSNVTLTADGFNGLTGAPGLSSTANLLTTGLGTITITFANSGVSSVNAFVNMWVFDPAGDVPFNEFGIVNGTAGSGVTYQISVPDTDSDGNHTGTSFANTVNNAYSNTNGVSGTASNYNGTCSVGVACDDNVSMGLGLSFTLASDMEEVISLNLSNTNPGGFSLEDVQPADTTQGGNNASNVDLYYSESAIQQCIPGVAGCGVAPPPPPPGVPEPGTLPLLALGLAAGVLLKALR